MSQELFSKLETQYGLPGGLLNAVWTQESQKGNPKYMLSPKGAKGHMGFMDPTAKQYGVDPHDLTSSATGAAKYFADLSRMFGGDLPRMLAGYNWGQGNVQKKGMDKLPAETRDYIQKVSMNMGAPSDPYADLIKKYSASGQAPQSAQESDPYAELIKKYSAQPVAPEQTQAQETPKKAGASMVSKNGFLSDVGNATARVGRDLIDGPAYVMPKGLEFLSSVGGLFPNRVSESLGAEARRVSDLNKKGEADYQAATPGSVTAGAVRAVGNVAPFVALPKLVGAAAKAPTLARSTMEGAGLAGLFGTRTEDDSFLANSAFGGLLGAAGHGLGQMAKSAINPSGGANVKSGQLATLDRAGVPYNAAQASNSPFLRALDGAMDYMPFTSGKNAAFKGAQREALTNAVGKELGAPAGPLTPDVMGQARQKAGREIGNITSQFTMSPQAGQGLVGDLSQIIANAQRYMPGDVQKAVGAASDDVLSKIGPTGAMEGLAYRALDSDLGKLAKSTSGDTANQIAGIREAMRKAMESSVPADQAAALKLAKQQYQNIMTMAPHLAKQVDGLVSPGGLNQTVLSGIKNAKFGAGGDLADLGRAAKLLQPMRDSGTAGRSMAQSLFTPSGSLLDLGRLAAGAAAVPVQRFMNSQRGVRMATEGLGGLRGIGGLLSSAQPGITSLLSHGYPGLLGRSQYEAMFSGQ